MSDRLVAFYGDDLTGSVDVLLQFARSGWRGRLFVGVPEVDRLREAAAEVDVVGVAGIARSLRTESLAAEVLPAFRALAALHPAVVQYKACSTADSSPSIGSIGRVLELARETFGPRPVPVLFAQPDFGRYTVFGHHFAAEDGAVHRLDRQPTMSTHPTTPMTESDLVRHLGAQTALPLTSLPVTAYTDADAVARRLRDADAAGVVLDAVSDHDIDLVGAALWRVTAADTPLVAIGSGGLSAALARASARGAAPSLAGPAVDGERGPVLAVSGSRSARTAAQVGHARDAGWVVMPLPLADAARDRTVRDAVAALRAGRSVVLTSSEQAVEAGADSVAVVGRAAAAAVAAALDARATRRVIVCGGDTSGRVTALLGVTSLRIAANPTQNVVLCVADAPTTAVDGVEILLKGGQVGPVDLFEQIRAL